MIATLRSLMAAAPSPPGLLTESNALLGRELRVALRNGRAFALMAAYVALLGAVVASNFPAGRQVTLGSYPGSGPEGRGLFILFMLAQAMLVVVILPALASGSLAVERERQTLEPLLLTPLTPAQIVWGKAVGVLLFGALLLIATVPVTSLCFLLNGIAPVDVIGAYAALLGLAAFVTGFGLYCSARWQNSVQAMLACYVLLPFALGLLLIFTIPGAIVGGIYLLAALVLQAAHWRRRLARRHGVLATVLLPLMGPLAVWLALAALGGRNVAILMFVLPYLMLVFRLGVEETARELGRRPEPRRPRAQRIEDLRAQWKRAVSPPEVVVASPTGRAYYTAPAPPQKLRQRESATYHPQRFLPDRFNPVLMKELRTGLTGRLRVLARLSYAAVIASEIWLLLQVAALSDNLEFEEILRSGFEGWAACHLGLVMMAGAVFGSRALAAEREQQTLVQLLTTPLSAWAIITGKLTAALVYTFSVFVIGAPLALLFAALGVVPWGQAVLLLLLEISAGVLAAAWGLWCSMHGQSVRRALAQALVGVAGFFFLNVLVQNAFAAALPGFGALAKEVDRVLLPFGAVSNILSALPGDGAGAYGRCLVTVCLYAAAAALLCMKTAAGFRRYRQNL